MTAPKKPRSLRNDEIDTIRMVARGYSNEEIAAALGIPAETLRSRMNNLHHLIGTSAEAEGSNRAAAGQSRVRMVIWAYEHGLADKATAEPMLPAKQSRPLLALCWSIVTDQPRGDLRRHAIAALQAAGVQLPTALGRPRKQIDTTAADAA